MFHSLHLAILSGRQLCIVSRLRRESCPGPSRCASISSSCPPSDFPFVAPTRSAILVFRLSLEFPSGWCTASTDTGQLGWQGGLIAGLTSSVVILGPISAASSEGQCQVRKQARKRTGSRLDSRLTSFSPGSSTSSAASSLDGWRDQLGTFRWQFGTEKPTKKIELPSQSSQLAREPRRGYQASHQGCRIARSRGSEDGDGRVATR